MSGYGAIPQIIDDNAHSHSTRSLSFRLDPREAEKLRRLGLASGICYVITIVCGLTAEFGFRGRMIDYSDPQGTADTIQANPVRFRQGMLVDLTMSCADIAVSVLLGLILVKAKANATLSLTLVVFRLMQQAVIVVNLLNMFAASLLLDKSMHPTMTVNSVVLGISEFQPVALSYFFLTLHKYGYLLALILFGVSMLLLGVVIVLYGIFPRTLGWLIGFAGVGYVIDSLLYFLWSGYDGAWTNYLMLPAILGEFGFAGWLLFRAPLVSDHKEC